MLDTGAQRIPGQRLDLALEAHRRLLEKMFHQQRDVLASFGKGWNHQLDNSEAIVQILAKRPASHERLQILVGGRNHAHVDSDRLVTANALELFLLTGPQQLGLCLQRHVADLVEKERATVGQLRTSPRAASSRR